MKRSTLIGIVCMAFLLGSCTAKGPVKPFPEFQPQPLDKAGYSSKVDNFLVILDASSSMGEFYNGQEKFTIANEFISRMNQILPEMGQNAGLRSFGHDPDLSKKLTMLAYGMEEYATANLAAGLDFISVPGGTSPLYKALSAAKEDLSGVSTKIAIIIVSDGKKLSSKTVETARALKEQFGPSLCLYPVLVGKESEGMALMQELSTIGGCVFSAKAEDLMTAEAMTEYVEKVFLSKRAAAISQDSDKDGVIDSIDECPDTPLGVPVDSVGCPLDSDGDGVYDYLDQCPGTPLGARVNSLGCWILLELLFDFDKAIIKSSSLPELNEIAVILKKNPGLKIHLKGHTCNIGSKKYNMDLSMRRANAVKKYLVSKDISMERITTEGFGFSKPVASNKTKQGRAMNRRVEIDPIK